MIVRLCLVLASLWLVLLIGGCGSGSSKAENSGEYVSKSWHDDTVAHLLVKPTGEVSGYLLVMYGWVYEMTGSVSASGVLTLSVKDPVTHQPVPGTTSTGLCDGAGSCTGTTYAGINQPFQFVLARVSPQNNSFAGIYNATVALDDGTPCGTSWFGIDANGKVYGFEDGMPMTDRVTVTGDVTVTGEMTATTFYSQSPQVTMSGKISGDGALSSGAWSTSSFMGKLSGTRLPIN
ncbi:hypothetical protein [Geomonas azotofigens]|uniref:hypothetical protein n=1 Tax=Geomonas azotofigens TaxID=2843196 RepID=UPI001C11472F|nr:hypothetical protein [Geomonas azotofigens]MBU5612164.1 hypothetical protein [Geomonas azotofigens]